MQLQSFRRLAAREDPGIAARLVAAKTRVAVQKQHEIELQQRYKELQALAADVGLDETRPVA